MHLNPNEFCREQVAKLVQKDDGADQQYEEQQAHRGQRFRRWLDTRTLARAVRECDGRRAAVWDSQFIDAS